MKKLCALFMALVMTLSALPALAQVQRDSLLDEALAMLEGTNGIISRYNAATGASVKAYFQAGIPYFWGGQDRKSVFGKYPKMVTRKAFSSSDYYKKGRRYFSGFDCTGFISAVLEGCKRKVPSSISSYISDKQCKNHVYCSKKKPLPEDWKGVAEKLTVGDILVLKHPSTHVMMFIGTLTDYGVTPQDCPALADYLDNPLMIHCSNAPWYYARFKKIIDESKENFIHSATFAPDGGVSIAMLGVPRDEAEHQQQVQDAFLYWDVVDADSDAPWTVTLSDISNADYAFYHSPTAFR